MLPQQLGTKVMTPLRQSIEGLNNCVAGLPKAIQVSVEQAMHRAFAAKLEQVFNVQTLLAEDAQRSLQQLAAISAALHESGQDFLQAAQALKHSSFASTLQDSVQGLIDCREQLTASTDGLSKRLLDLRDSLITTQSEWKVLAKTAEQELNSCRLAIDHMQIESRALRMASAGLSEASQANCEASKQLRETRLEVMRDRKLTISVAEAIQARLRTDSSVAESCQLFVGSLQSCLDDWHRSMQQLDELQTQLLNLTIKARRDDAELMSTERREAQELIRRLRQQLMEEIGTAIQSQYEALINLNTPTREAGTISQQLELQLSSIRQQLDGLHDELDVLLESDSNSQEPRDS